MPADYGHDMPKRYCGKEIAYGVEPFDHLAGNNNTRIPPYEQMKAYEIGKTSVWDQVWHRLPLVISVGVAVFLVL